VIYQGITSPELEALHTELPGRHDATQTIPLAPFKAHGSPANHKVHCSAPRLGQHTDEILKKGWAPRCADAMEQCTPASEGKGLKGVKVIELSEYGCCVSSAAAQMADYGATVIKVEHIRGDPWRTDHEKFFWQLNRGKKIRQVDYFTTNGKAYLQELGLGHEEVCQQYPRLIYGLVTPWGVGQRETHRGDLGAWWAASNFASTCDFRQLPLQFGELVSSFQFLSGVCSALFHQQRHGTGQLIDMSMLRAGDWAAGVWIFILSKIPDLLTILPEFGTMEKKEAIQVFREINLPTTHCHRTKDGMWVQLLGPNLMVDAVIMGEPLGIWIKSGLLWALCTESLWTGGSKINKAIPIFRNFNSKFESAISALNYEEFCALAYGSCENGDQIIRHVVVATPQTATEWVQHHASGTFCYCQQWYVSSPTQLSDIEPTVLASFTHWA